MVKGPSSALWGSDALAGVINIITEKPGQEAFSASLSSRYGSHNTLDLSGQVSHQSGGWENQLFANLNRSGGYRLESLGRVMALTRNHAAVHEKHGLYQNVSFEGHAGLVLDENIDLRIFYKRWSAGFALPVAHPQGPLHSLQFFDKQGEAVHKMYLKKPDDVQLAAYHVLDPEFNLHLNQGGIAKCWLVEKPTEDGPVHSLELYDAEGATIASFFGARKPGIPQRKDWEQIIHEIRPLEAV